MFSHVPTLSTVAQMAKGQYLNHVQPIVTMEQDDLFENPFTDEKLDAASAHLGKGKLPG